MSIKNKYAIVGVGYTSQGQTTDRTALSYYVEAGVNAIEDAGLNRRDIDGLICYRYFPPQPNELEVTGYRVAQHLGLSPRMLSQEANCARSQVINALGWLELGLCNYVLIIYGDKPPAKGADFLARIPVNNTDAVYGLFGAPGAYALAATRAMHTFGTGPETWKEIAVGQRKWASLNPRAAMYNRPLGYEDYRSFPWLVRPFRLPDCCLITEGGRACIITSVERARELRHKPAIIMGAGQHNPSTDIQQAAHMTGPTGARESGEMALRMAGIEIGDVDACEIYDCFTYTVEVTMQDYGFFGPGEGKDWLQGGTIAPGGPMPVNTSGGQLSEAYFMGLTQLTEGAMQLMGRCGQRQLGPQTDTGEPEIILCCDNGGILQTHSTIILRR